MAMDTQLPAAIEAPRARVISSCRGVSPFHSFSLELKFTGYGRYRRVYVTMIKIKVYRQKRIASLPLPGLFHLFYLT